MSSATTDPSSTSPTNPPVVPENTTSPADTSRLSQPTDAVAMDNIAQTSGASENDKNKEIKNTSDGSLAPQDSVAAAAVPNEESTTDKAKESQEPAEASSASAPVVAPPQPAFLKDRQDSVMAIGPAQDDIKAVTPGAPDSGPVCNITLLLTTGSRHPYKLDSKYLNRRNVSVPEETESGHPDPFSISIYTLKELILREWRGDWEAKPASPGSIRLIHFGKLLDDKEPLKKYQFSADAPNVVHMSVRPPDLDEEEPKGGGKNSSAGGAEGLRQRSGGCCVIL